MLFRSSRYIRYRDEGWAYCLGSKWRFRCAGSDRNRGPHPKDPRYPIPEAVRSLQVLYAASTTARRRRTTRRTQRPCRRGFAAPAKPRVNVSVRLHKFLCFVSTPISMPLSTSTTSGARQRWLLLATERLAAWRGRTFSCKKEWRSFGVTDAQAQPIIPPDLAHKPRKSGEFRR